MVMGPTPPGTGVMALAFFDTPLNSTSPTSRVPLFFVALAVFFGCLFGVILAP